MLEKNSSKTGRQPPDQAALVVMFGIEVRLSRWGVTAIILATVVVIASVLFWMTPTEAEGIITVIRGN